MTTFGCGLNNEHVYDINGSNTNFKKYKYILNTYTNICIYIYMYEYKVQSLHLATELLLEFQLSHSDFRSWQGNWQCWGFTAQAQWHKRRAIQQTKRLGCSRSFKKFLFS